MLTQSILTQPSLAIGWDGDPDTVAEAKRAWIRLLFGHHANDDNQIYICAAALRRHLMTHGLGQEEVDAAIKAARDMMELIARD